MNDIRERRADLEDKLSALKMERGIATLDGRKFDASKISAMESELDGLREAEGEAARRAREQAEAEHQKHIAAMRKELARLEDERLRALQDANVAARTLAESIERAIDTQRRQTEVAHAITDGKIPKALNVPDFVSRLGGRLASIMKTIPRYPARLGAIEWKGASLYAPFDDWRECERAKLEPHLKPFIEKEKTNGKD